MVIVTALTVAQFFAEPLDLPSKTLPSLVVHQPDSRPRAVSRRSALSMRSSSRCSARDVNIRYGSRQPRVVEIVDQDADVRLVAPERRTARPRDRLRGVDARDQSLRGGLLVAGRAVDLPGEKQPAHALASRASRRAPSAG